MAVPPHSSHPLDHPVRLWATRLVALLALFNLGLVGMDASYLPWRDWYLRLFPSFTRWYGETFKGIEPHRDTERYLREVEQLQQRLEAGENLRSPAVTRQLTQLRALSIEMVDTNPFALANKSGTLERIKNEMRDRLDNESSKQAFVAFWSPAYLQQAEWQQELAFFNESIRPLMATNYFRHIDESGGFVDRFWVIDLGFIILFGTLFLTRTVYLHLRQGKSWLDAVFDYWFDLFLLLPFWRLLRIIPVTIRLQQARLLNLNPIRTRISHRITASFATELTEIVVSRLIDQMQALLRGGAITQWLLQPRSRRYIDISGVDEVELIANHILSLLVYHILPKVQPDIEALIQHSLSRVLQQMPLYPDLQRIPGLSDLPQRLTTQLAAEISATAYQALVSALEDTTAKELTRQLIDHLGDALRTEIQSQETVQEIEALVVVLLEEIKLSYVNQINVEEDRSPEPLLQPYPIPRIR